MIIFLVLLILGFQIQLLLGHRQEGLKMAELGAGVARHVVEREVGVVPHVRDRMGLLERDRLSGGYFETEVNLWQIVDLRVATVPGELPPHLGLQLKRLIAGHPTMIVGLANDELGYLLPSSEFELPIYEYERELCPGFAAGDRVVARLEELALLAAESEAGAQEASSAEADPDGSSRP